eukprot:414096_1
MDWLSVVKLHHLIERSSYKWVYMDEEQIRQQRRVIIQHWIRLSLTTNLMYSLKVIIPLIISYAEGSDWNAEIPHCLHILRRTPPSDIENNLERLVALRPDLDEELCNKVDLPFEIDVDPTTGQKFIICDFNRDGDSYRSPWSNKYFPPIEDGFMPSKEMRAFEIEANSVFEVYKHQYFDANNAVSSVYVWDMDAGSFGACFCIFKHVVINNSNIKKASWSSTHVFEVKSAKEKDKWNYTLTSTVFVIFPFHINDIWDIDLSGYIVKQSEKVSVLLKEDVSHLQIMGPMIEDLELSLQNDIQGVLFQKIKQIVYGMILEQR